MNISPKRIEESYTRYESAQSMWTNINSGNINTISKLMYNLYKTLDEGPILNSAASYEEKKAETEGRFADLGNFIFDTESIKVLAARNNKAYAFLPIKDNPFKMSDEQCEKVYKVDTKETLIETKARTIDCENKVAKMCIAQIVNIVEPDAKSRATSEEDIKKELVTRVEEYTILLNKMQRLKLYEHPELQQQEELFTSSGFFSMKRFLEKANQTNIEGKPIELKQEYGQIVDTVKNQQDDEEAQSLNITEYDINNLGKFAIARNLMSKMYEYKEMDLYDLLTEYDLIKGTDAESKVLITSNKDAKTLNKNIERVIHIAIQGYNQPFSVHVRDDSYKRYEEKFGEIPSSVLAPVARKSKVTFKLERPIQSIVSSVYKQDRGTKTIQYLEYLEELQDINECRENVKYKQSITKKEKEEQELKEQKEKEEQEIKEQKEKSKIISGINKKIRKFTSEINQLQRQKKDIHTKINGTAKAKKGEFDKRKIIQKQSQKSNKDYAMKKIKQADEMEKELEKLREKKAELEQELRRLQKEDEKTKDK